MRKADLFNDAVFDSFIDSDVVPTAGRWSTDSVKLHGFAQQIPALAWPVDAFRETEDVMGARAALEGRKVVIMPDAKPGLYGTLEGYVVEVPSTASVSELMFGINGPAMLSTWILNDTSPKLLDGILGVADATIGTLADSVASSFWDLSPARNPYRRMSERFQEEEEEENGMHQAVADISYGLSDNARIMLIKYHKHPRAEYRLLIQGGSPLADAYLRAKFMQNKDMQVGQAATTMDVALQILRRHHAMLAHALMSAMADAVADGESADESIHRLLMSPSINKALQADNVGFAVSDTEQVYNCLHHMQGAEEEGEGEGESRYLFYNHCVCMHLSRGALFLDSGSYFVALMQPNRATNASTLTTIRSEIPYGQAAVFWSFPLSMPYERMVTAADYRDWGDEEEKDRQFGIGGLKREDFLIHENLQRIYKSMLQTEETGLDILQFIPAGVAHVSSRTGYTKPISRILYDYIEENDCDASGYPKALSREETYLGSTRVMYATHTAAQTAFAKATLNNTYTSLPFGPNVHGHEISTVLNNGYTMIPHRTLVWLNFSDAMKRAIVDYYEGRAPLPSKFRMELQAQHTMYPIPVPISQYIA